MFKCCNKDCDFNFSSFLKIMETVVDYDDIQRFLVEVLIRKTLPKYINNYKTSDYYPVILGGQNVLRCAENNKKVAALISGVFSSDIDIDFVIIPNVQNNDDPIVQDLHKRRLKFLDEVLQDTDFTYAINQVMRDYAHLDMHVETTVDEKMMYSDPIVSRSMVVRLRINYYIGYEPSNSLTLMDTVIYSTYSKTEHYDLFRQFTKSKVSLVIPYKIYKGLPFAHCEHAYYDTIRMLDTYATEISITTSPKRFKFLISKYANLLLKFSALYCLLNRVNKKKYDKLKQIYDNVRQILLSMNPFADMNSLSQNERRRLNEIYNIVKDVTDIDLLIKIIKRENKQYRFTSKFKGIVKTRSSR